MIAAGVTMWRMDPWLALTGLAVVPVIFAINVAYERVITPRWDAGQSLRADVSTIAHESFEGGTVVKALGAEARETERFARVTNGLRDADTKSIARIAVEARDLAERARARKLRVPELSGATFSISNLGMFDVTEFSAIINPPEGAILAVGTVRKVPVVAEDGLGVGRRMTVTLSCDHRVMDGAMGARFLQDVKRLLEEPLRLLV